MARMKARHSSDIAKRSTPAEMQGLQPVIFLAKGAHVILTMSLWTNVGLCNGETGTVLDCIYATSQQPPNLLITVVKFHDYGDLEVLNEITVLSVIKS